MKIITKDEFLKLYRDYYGEPVMELDEIVTQQFSGQELFELIEYIINHCEK